MRVRLTTFVAVVLLLATTTAVWAQGYGVIEGQVFDGSSDGAPLEGLRVTLWAFAGPEPETSFETTTDEEGRFRFEGLETERYAYRFEVEYVGVQYGSELVSFREGENLISIPFTVYESTTSDEALSVERAHLIVSFEPGTIRVQEVQILLNRAVKTYVGPTGEEGGTTVHFPLPQGASAVRLIEGLMECCAVETDTGVASTQPIFPGSKQFVFSYELRHESATDSLSLGIAYPTNSLDVLIADVGVQVTAPGLVEGERLSLEGGNYLHLTGKDLAPTDEVLLHFTNLPMGAAPEPTAISMFASPLLTWAVLGGVVLGLFFVLAYPFFRATQGESK